MNSAAPNPTSGFTPGKIGLIAVLAVLLVGTIVYQFSGTSSSPPTYTKRASLANADDQANPTTASNQTGIALRAVGGKWPQISAAEASEFDPFAFPLALSKSSSQSAHSRSALQSLQVESSEHSANSNLTEHVGGKSPPSGGAGLAESRPEALKRRLEEQQAVAAELQRRGVGLVFQTSQGSVARLGDLEVRVGDVLNGLRVVEINADGIRLIPEAVDGSSPK
jgi:hypothetical protein